MKKLNEVRVARELVIAAMDVANAAHDPEIWQMRAEEYGEALIDLLDLIDSASYLWREGAVQDMQRYVRERLLEETLFDDGDESPTPSRPLVKDVTEARLGDVWLLTFTDGRESGAYIFDGMSFTGELHPGGGNSYERDSDLIASARRIWGAK